MGVLPDGSVVLVEAEFGPIQDWHIQIHLTRVAVMIARKTSVERLVWVTKVGTQNKLRNIVEGWSQISCSALKAELPRMEYVTIEQLD
jgi:hypothetical protein